MVLALPLHDSTGRLSGVIAVPVDLAHFGPIVAEIALLPGETLTLVNGTDRLLARQPDPAQWMGTDIRNTGIGQSVLAGGERITQVRDIDGTERVFGFTTVAGTDWYVYSGLPLTRILAIWQSGAVVVIGLFTFGLALAVGFALLADRWIARPVRILAVSADAVAAGDLTARVEAGGFAEAAVLAERFNEMVERRRSAEEGLRASERNLAEAQRIAHIGSWEWDLATGLAQRSEELHRIFGVEPGAIPETNEAFLAFVHPDDRARVQASERAAISGSGQHGLDYRIAWPDGTVRIVHEEGELIRDPSGTPARLVGTVQDITERVAAEEERTRLVSAVEQAADPIWITDPDGTIRYVNSALERLFGYRADELLGRNARILRSDQYDGAFFADLWATIGSGRKWAGSLWNRHKDGTLVEVESVVSPIHDAEGRLTGYIQADRDVTRERELEGALARRARERQTIEAALERIDSGSAPEEIAAVACTQFIGLPNVDSAFVIALDQGHGRVLAVEGRLAAAFAAGRLIPGPRARYLLERASGGPWTEEWQARPEDGMYGEQVAATGLHTIAYAPLRGLRGVIGLIGFGTHDRAPDEMIEQLPALTSLASILGTLLTPGLETRQRDDAARASIKAILDAGAFTPFFQPIVEFHTGAVVGYEALSRFTDGTGPDIVFASAARAGLGVELEVATLEAALGAAAVLPPEAYLSLNASPALIGSGRLGPLLAGLRRRITLEVTEHAVVEDYAALRGQLSPFGPNVRLAVDDAGAGYASLRHILELAPDFVKLDVGLVRGIDTDPARQALIAGMGYFAVKRKVHLIAEGIETAEELAALRVLAVPYGQGYLLGRPQDGRGPGPWPTQISLSTSDGAQG